MDQIQAVPTPTLLSICLGERWRGSVIICDGRDHPGWGQISGQNVKIEVPCQLAEPCIICHSWASHVKICDQAMETLHTTTQAGAARNKTARPSFFSESITDSNYFLLFSNITLYTVCHVSVLVSLGLTNHFRKQIGWVEGHNHKVTVRFLTWFLRWEFSSV